MKGIKILRLISVLVCLCLIFCSCSAKPNDDENKNTSDYGEILSDVGELTLIYSANDSLNPYNAVTKANGETSLLMFDPLIKLDNNFNVVNVLAQSVSKIENSKITVELKSAVFTDGSALTAEDVVFSFNTAKASKTKYSFQLQSVVSCSAKSSTQVEFTFSKNDPYGVNLLDFPIIKQGSENRTDEDNVALPPIGCGRYYFDRKTETLCANEQYHTGEIKVKRISLLNCPDDEAIDHNISVGAVDIYYADLSDENIIRMSGQRTSVNLNNLVYLGANSSPDNILSNVHLRYAVSAAISRQDIAGEAYYQNALPATGIFSPAFEDSKQYQTLQKTSDKQIVVVNLEEIGYNSFDDEGFAVNGKGKRLKLSVLVNEESTYKRLAADLIAKQLCDAGISATVTSVPYAEYMARLGRGEFDLYLAETLILNNMDITQLVCEGGSAAYGVHNVKVETQQESVDTESNLQTPNDSGLPQTSVDSNDINCEKIINSFYNGECEIGSVATIFESQLPIIPVVYKTGILFYSNRIQSVPGAAISDIFFSIESFSVNSK